MAKWTNTQKDKYTNTKKTNASLARTKLPCLGEKPSLEFDQGPGEVRPGDGPEDHLSDMRKGDQKWEGNMMRKI